jgi:hypothetical protein
MNQDIDKIMKRTQSYFYEDGVAEIAVGVLFVAIGLLMLVIDAASTGPVLAVLTGLGLPALTIGGVFAVRWAVRVVKNRMVYPRTGYVSYREQPSRQPTFALLVMMALFVFILFLPEWAETMPVFEGWFLGVFFIYVGYRVGLKRLYAIGALAVLVGFGAAFLRLGDILGSTVTFGVTGLVLVISGGLALLAYLRRNPMPEVNS